MTEDKKVQIDLVREAFMTFMHVVMSIPGAPMQKQQAFLRFDEGHMWMQNAVITYVDPVAASAEIIEAVPGDMSVEVVPVEAPVA